MPWRVKEVNTGYYEFRFRLNDDMDKVIRGRPWTLNGAQLILIPWLPYLLIHEINSKASPFVVRFKGLPPAYQSEHKASTMGNMVEKYVRLLGRSINELRVSVEMNVSNNILASFSLNEEE